MKFFIIPNFPYSLQNRPTQFHHYRRHLLFPPFYHPFFYHFGSFPHVFFESGSCAACCSHMLPYLEKALRTMTRFGSGSSQSLQTQVVAAAECPGCRGVGVSHLLLLNDADSPEAGRRHRQVSRDAAAALRRRHLVHRPPPWACPRSRWAAGCGCDDAVVPTCDNRS